MKNAKLDEVQGGIKSARRNINNLRYADYTSLMAESKEELKSLLMKMEESEIAGFKLNIQQVKIMASSRIHSVQSLSCVQLCDPVDCSTPGLLVHHQLPTCSNSCPSSQWYRPTILSSVVPFSFWLQIFPASGSFPMSQFASGGQRPKYWSFSFNISPSNEYSGLVSFRMDWLDLLAVQGTLKSFLQQNSSKASILQCSASNSHIHKWLVEKP